ncbi:hypothetical protein M885DRAFT_547751 [Pelagophyceae sp. CCMP2097]|nr:hypothetical protein M885DRAFT_547751 [Pelagophyceae sp. CCMP2097]
MVALVWALAVAVAAADAAARPGLARRHGGARACAGRVSAAAVPAAVDGPRPGLLYAAARWYDGRLTAAPLLTKSATSGCVSCVGDALAQFSKTATFVADSTHVFDARRSAAFALLGALYFGPFLHFWYNALARLEVRWRRRGMRKPEVVAIQLVLNQSVGAGIVNAGFFFMFAFAQSALAPYSSPTPLIDARAAFRANYRNVMFANWIIWPIPSLLNLWFVPLQYRVAYTNCVAVVWKFVLSLLTTR